ncbi:ABC transporter ATP-binding protein [Luteolibacter flavescens]|uniref:ABC transporter ATP-binding protein n=1 Tax=Luteolibacter flavescens TaxID=1859460 RepID=A0ABT3FSP1_9BACT|nr:ABC transporter ATP-binding protein [Luteolibacter flavescens]MCW1886599.1 ABC transporter ATP-binding protein [Luteolibacter flavescens]
MISWTDPSSSMPADLVRISGLGVDYGDRRAVDGVHLRIPPGEVFGLLGPNGAGKTTMFRVMATLLPPTRGEVELCGENIQSKPREVRSTIAYMPDLAPMPSDLRAVEYLRFYAESYGLRGKERDARVTECLESVGLRERSKDICTKLSLGMRQRLALAKAILHRPRLLILDEPASGLDPMARADLKNALRRQADAGATVILSSHIMAEIQDLCTSIGLLQRGRLLDAGPIRKVLAKFGQAETRVIVRSPGRRDEVAAWLREVPGVSAEFRIADEESIELRLDEAKLSRAALFTALGEARLGVTGMHAVETSVEEVVVRLGSQSSLS